MGSIHKQIFILFLFSLVLYTTSATSDSENKTTTTERLITAPLKDTIGSVIDGNNLGEVFNTINEELDGKKSGNSNSNSNNRVSVTTVALFTLAMAAATGLGALPFFFVELDAQWAGICNGMAAGVMLAASFDLIQEGRDHGSGSWVVMGILTGGIFIWLCKQVCTESITSFKTYLLWVLLHFYYFYSFLSIMVK